MPQTRVAAADVGGDGFVARVAGMRTFGIRAGAPFVASWPEEIAAGVAGRLGNEAMPAVDVQGALANGRVVWFSLSPYQPARRLRRVSA